MSLTLKTLHELIGKKKLDLLQDFTLMVKLDNGHTENVSLTNLIELSEANKTIIIHTVPLMNGES